jgi:outer membrane protein assembly factor BamB
MPKLLPTAAEPTSGATEVTRLTDEFPLEMVWEYNTSAISNQAPHVGGDQTVYLGVHDKVLALSAATGVLKWETAIRQGGNFSTLSVTQSSVYVTGEASRELVSLFASDGQVRWRMQLDDVLAVWQNVFVESVVATENYVLVSLMADRSTRIVCVDALTGRVVWQTRPYEEPWYLGGEGWAYLTGNQVLLIRNSGWIEMNFGSGSISRIVSGRISVSPRPPLYTPNLVYTTGRQAILALDMWTLKERWRFLDKCSEWNVAPRIVAAADGVAYAFSTCNRLVALSEPDGRPLWDFAPSRGETVQSFIIFQDQGYLLTTGFSLYQFDLKTGSPLAQLFLPDATLPWFRTGELYATSQLLLVRVGQNGEIIPALGLGQWRFLAFKEKTSVTAKQ